MAASTPMMKRKITSVDGGKEILANDHYVGVPYCFMADQKAGDVVIDLEKGVVGVCLYDVNNAENPNGTVVIHGFIDSTKLTEDQNMAILEAGAQMPMIQLVM